MVLAIDLAESLLSLGRWDEAAEVIEHALELSPPPGPRAALLQLPGELALARGDLPRAAESAAASRDALAGCGYQDQYHLPLARLEIELHLRCKNGPPHSAFTQLVGVRLWSSHR